MATEVPHHAESTMDKRAFKVQSFTVWWTQIKIQKLDTHSFRGSGHSEILFQAGSPLVIHIHYYYSLPMVWMVADKKLMFATESLLVISSTTHRVVWFQVDTYHLSFA